MNYFTKNFAAGLTALAVTSALMGSAAYANAMHGGGFSRGNGGMQNFARVHDGSAGKAIRSTKLGKADHVSHKHDDDFNHRHDGTHDHDHDHDRKIDIVLLTDPPVLGGDPGVHVIGDDPKPGDGGHTVSKAPACKWIVTKVSITNYGQTTGKEKSAWLKKFEDSALDYAKDFVKKNATKLGQTVMKAIIEDTTITRTMDVLITYACVDQNNAVVATKVVGPIQDQYAMHWWTGAKLADGNEHDRQAAIAKNRPLAQPVTAQK